MIFKKAKEAGALDAVFCEQIEKGGGGAVVLAEAVLAACKKQRASDNKLQFSYDDDDSLEEKVRKICRATYLCDNVSFTGEMLLHVFANRALYLTFFYACLPFLKRYGKEKAGNFYETWVRGLAHLHLQAAHVFDQCQGLERYDPARGHVSHCRRTSFGRKCVCVCVCVIFNGVLRCARLGLSYYDSLGGRVHLLHVRLAGCADAGAPDTALLHGRLPGHRHHDGSWALLKHKRSKARFT